MEKEIEKLSGFVGVWNCTETYHAGGWTPTTVTSTSAQDVIRFGPGGNTIIADYQSDSAIGHYEAHDVIAWDEAAQTFKFFFFDSFSTGFQVQNGNIESNVATFSSREQLNGTPGTLRRTYTFADNSQDLEVEFIDEEDKVTKLISINKTRSS